MWKWAKAALGFGWRRTGDLSLLAWIFPNLWTQVLPGAAMVGTATIGVLMQTPPVLWVPLAFAATALALLSVHLWQHHLGLRLDPGADEKYAEHELKLQVSKWLSSRLSLRELHVQDAFLFGSVVHDHYPTSDVDVIVTFKSVSDRRIGAAVRKINGIVGADFERTFGHKLHATFFCFGESAQQAEFFLKAGAPKLFYSAAT